MTKESVENEGNQLRSQISILACVKMRFETRYSATGSPSHTIYSLRRPAWLIARKSHSMVKWRIGMVQMIPELAQVEKNRKRLLELTSKLHPGTLDLLCLPEMVLTGYTFPSASAIEPYLERPGEGPTSLCCSELAKRLRCHVIAGYPEVSEEKKLAENAVGYNSAIICGPDGQINGTYRKSNLFKTDMNWAIAGSGFGLFDLGNPIGQISLGICMDLNPFPPAIWTSEDGPYELATFACENGVSLVVVLCAWLDSGKDPEAKRDFHTVHYWLARLFPLWRRILNTQSQNETIVVMCNRAGSEGDSLFAGTSAIFRLSPNLDAPEIIGIMSRREEAAHIWSIS